ncbi:hypothetical protein HDF19_13230 [Mucilaginibacter sp. E4BP6]|uniref:hypothetical protein n=1 Tax=Mucilaginibacter sp. E4BP6 TaxID=2723089 RepID=UPI0015C8185B|nr:hypothetical protein [Mucilaginibacter sp. E4BP6]NYE66059.1 hypothetical protein [Mucilaginibacter sp. E4BP6]
MNCTKSLKTLTHKQAVFLLGAGHRNSIMQKIKEYNSNIDFKLNWKFYNPEDSIK